MGRAIVREPRVFLMDEPLSNLDAKLRVTMRAQLSLLHQRLGVTTVYVTHDQVEAMTLGQRVAVLRDGVLQQCDTPQHLYRHPVNLFVAAFIGSPSMNFVHATVADGAVALRRRRRSRSRPARRWPTHERDGHPRHAADRFAPRIGHGWPTLSRSLPRSSRSWATSARDLRRGRAPGRHRGDPGRGRRPVADDALLLPEDRARFTVRLPTDTPIKVGEPLTLAINPDRLYFFDPDTGDAIDRPTD